MNFATFYNAVYKQLSGYNELNDKNTISELFKTLGDGRAAYNYSDSVISKLKSADYEIPIELREFLTYPNAKARMEEYFNQYIKLHLDDSRINYCYRYLFYIVIHDQDLSNFKEKQDQLLNLFDEKGNLHKIVNELFFESCRNSNGNKKVFYKDDLYLDTDTSFQFEMMSFFRLKQLHFTALDIAKQIVQNDIELYKLPQENEGSIYQWASFLEAYPETFNFLVHNNNDRYSIIGNWSLTAFNDEDAIINDLNNGTLLEGDFSLSDCAPLNVAGDYICYILNVSVNLPYNTVSNYNKLLSSLINQIDAFANNEIYFKAFYVNVFREEHEALFKKFGFEYVCDNVSSGKIYTLAFNRFEKLLHPDTLIKYTKHFNN